MPKAVRAADLNLQGSAAYLRQQMTAQIGATPSLLQDSAWMQVYTSCIVAAELEAIRGVLERLALNRPEGTDR